MPLPDPTALGLDPRAAIARPVPAAGLVLYRLLAGEQPQPSDFEQRRNAAPGGRRRHPRALSPERRSAGSTFSVVVGPNAKDMKPLWAFRSTEGSNPFPPLWPMRRALELTPRRLWSVPSRADSERVAGDADTTA